MAELPKERKLIEYVQGGSPVNLEKASFQILQQKIADILEAGKRLAPEGEERHETVMLEGKFAAVRKIAASERGVWNEWSINRKIWRLYILAIVFSVLCMAIDEFLRITGGPRPW